MFTGSTRKLWGARKSWQLLRRGNIREMVNIILWIILGALAGWIASMIMGTNARQGGLMNIVVGILGAVVGGFVLKVITGREWTSGFDIPTFLAALLGACIILFVYKALTKRA